MPTRPTVPVLFVALLATACTTSLAQPLPSGQPPARGAEAIRKAYSQGAGVPLHLRPIAFGSSGELAYVIGGFGPAADKPEFGKFTLVLRRSLDGRWRIVSDMDNGNQPRRPAPPPQPAGQ